MLAETRKARNPVVRQIVLSLSQLDERSEHDGRNASRNSRFFGRKNILNVEGLIGFCPTKYNIILSQTLYQNLRNKDACLDILSSGGIGYLVRSGFLLAFG